MSAFDSELYSVIDGKVICNACNVRSEFLGEHRCFGDDGGRACECQSPLCRLKRGEVTLAELEAEGST